MAAWRLSAGRNAVRLPLSPTVLAQDPDGQRMQMMRISTISLDTLNNANLELRLRCRGGVDRVG